MIIGTIIFTVTKTVSGIVMCTGVATIIVNVTSTVIVIVTGIVICTGIGTIYSLLRVPLYAPLQVLL